MTLQLIRNCCSRPAVTALARPPSLVDQRMSSLRRLASPEHLFAFLRSPGTSRLDGAAGLGRGAQPAAHRSAGTGCCTSGRRAGGPRGRAATPAVLSRAGPTRKRNWPLASRPDVVLRLTVNTSGQVTGVELAESAGRAFDEAGLAGCAGTTLRTPLGVTGCRWLPASCIASRSFRPRLRLPAEASPLALGGELPPPTASLTAPLLPSAVVGRPQTPHAPREGKPPETETEVSVQGERAYEERLEKSADAVTVIRLDEQKKRSSDMGEILARIPGVVIRRARWAWAVTCAFLSMASPGTPCPCSSTACRCGCRATRRTSAIFRSTASTTWRSTGAWCHYASAPTPWVAPSI